MAAVVGVTATPAAAAANTICRLSPDRTCR
jgi:hypothetical protein